MASGRIAQALLRARVHSRMLGEGCRRSIQQQHRHGTVLQLKHLGGGTRRVGAIPWLRGFSSSASSSSSATTTDGGQAEAASALDEPEAVQERRGTWVIKGLVLAMLTYIGMNVVPLMGESMVRQSLALVRVKDPFFKRSGASRLSQIATDDTKRKKIVDAGGVAALLGMLETAFDDDTRREAVKALASLSPYGGAVEAMHEAGGQFVLKTCAASTSDTDTQECIAILLEKLKQWKANNST
ncbi:unnamed protein product [Sphagnum troendelagicum]